MALLYRVPEVCRGTVSSYSGGSSEGEIRLKVSSRVSTFTSEESAGTEAGGGHGHDTQQGSSGTPVLTAGRELCVSSGNIKVLMMGWCSVKNIYELINDGICSHIGDTSYHRLCTVQNILPVLCQSSQCK